MQRTFRSVYRVEGNVRLMETAGAEPATWRLQFSPNSGPVMVEIHDVVVNDGGVPMHRGLEIQVDLASSTIDEASKSAEEFLSTVMTVISAAARAPVHPANPFLVYETTPDIQEREFVQWFDHPDLPAGRTVVPPAVFAALVERIGLLPEKVGQRLRTSMDWHGVAMRQTDQVLRFVGLWFACEALEKRLTEHYSLESSQGFQGLRTLADAVGLGGESVTRALGVRRALFHDLSEPTSEVRSRAIVSVPELESLLPPGWMTLLGSSELIADFPTRTFTPHQIRESVHGVFLDPNQGKWGGGIHPYLARVVSKQPTEPTRPGGSSASYQSTYSLVNVLGARLGKRRLFGPSSPNPPIVSDFGYSITRGEEPAGGEPPS